MIKEICEKFYYIYKCFYSATNEEQESSQPNALQTKLYELRAAALLKKYSDYETKFRENKSELTKLFGMTVDPEIQAHIRQQVDLPTLIEEGDIITIWSVLRAKQGEFKMIY